MYTEGQTTKHSHKGMLCSEMKISHGLKHLKNEPDNLRHNIMKIL